MFTDFQITEMFLRKNPRARPITFTLTRRNMPFRDLHNAVVEMSRAYDMFAGLRLWFALGTFRHFEVTFPQNDECHPHIHCLMVVGSDYFSPANKVYVHARELGSFWKIALGVDYEPVTDMRAVRELYNVARWFDYLEAPSVHLTDVRISKFGGRLAELERQLRSQEEESYGIERQDSGVSYQDRRERSEGARYG